MALCVFPQSKYGSRYHFCRTTITQQPTTKSAMTVRMSGGGAAGRLASYEEGNLERPNWTGQTPLSRLVGALISFKPLYSLLKLGARQVLISLLQFLGDQTEYCLNSTAEKSNVPWRAMTKEILESDVYKEMETIQNADIVYPDWCDIFSSSSFETDYLKPFHAYDEGNLSWLAAAEVEAATMSMVKRAIPDASSVDDANEIVRGNWLNAIEQHHQQFSGNLKIRDILDVGCSVGVSTRFLADKFPSAKLTFHECPATATINLVKEAFRLLRPGGTFVATDNSPKSKKLQELSPVLFTLMKSTEPFLDEYYLLDLEKAVNDAGFINVQTRLTDPRHRTLTATVPY
ncbi:hypothetical protein Ccrd_017270 [Cynara cardunculus var. scolymus]|uniref:Uncharacterized protein n=1 Tax=Cynara cardunculus var. scolymus TaxID=59895 RepID=A0A103Y8E4_CYNCS|nr:hypothetical protein Ccrd_017270 [Cynara cardunculus var. scolymus]